ncbi:MAG: hypothetical protein LC640_09060 [Frankia sp.]|nr:hypothetical protein [Frankia sp.]
MKLYASATIPPAVQLLVCGEKAAVSIALALTIEQAEAHAADVLAAVATAREMRSRVTTRRACSVCLRDCSACTCSSAKRGGAA